MGPNSDRSRSRKKKKQCWKMETWKETPFGSVAERGGEAITASPPSFPYFLFSAAWCQPSEAQKGQCSGGRGECDEHFSRNQPRFNA